MIVVDASVAIKWYFPEAGSEAAADLLDTATSGWLQGPDLLAIEVRAAFVRGANMDRSRRNDAMRFIADFERKQTDGTLTLHRPSAAALSSAANIAIDLGHPLKDCLYLTLARDLACPLLTADERFAGRARETYPEVRLLGEQGQ